MTHIELLPQRIRKNAIIIGHLGIPQQTRRGPAVYKTTRRLLRRFSTDTQLILSLDIGLASCDLEARFPVIGTHYSVHFTVTFQRSK